MYTRQHWILVSNLISRTKATDIKTFFLIKLIMKVLVSANTVLKLIELIFFVVRERKDKERQSCPGLNGEKTFTKLTIFLLTFYFFFSRTKRNTATSNKCIEMYTNESVKVFRYSFSEAIPIFFKGLKSGFLSVRSLYNFYQ